MATVSPLIIRRSAKDLAYLCGVDLATARRWRRGAICPPKVVLKYLEVLDLIAQADLGFLDPKWVGWVLRDGKLVSQENWQFTPGAVRATRFHDAQIRTYRTENRHLKMALEEAGLPWNQTLLDQPAPEDFASAQLKLTRVI